jgi:LmbE family N-acetylglucosaminyl deacetylase
MREAISAGFDRREAYGLHRRKEAESALALANIPADHLQCLCFVEQEASMNLVAITSILAEAFAAAAPDALLTHAYEGGHPDHDATAFAVHAACDLLWQAGRECPAILEMSSYHNNGGTILTSHFIPHQMDGGSLSRRQRSAEDYLAIDASAKQMTLTAHQRRLKQRMFDRFASQRAVLSQFPIEREFFRPGRRYDFEAPPHPGTLYYEMFDWGLNGRQWRALARAALQELGVVHNDSASHQNPRLPTVRARRASCDPE